MRHKKFGPESEYPCITDSIDKLPPHPQSRETWKGFFHLNLSLQGRCGSCLFTPPTTILLKLQGFYLLHCKYHFKLEVPSRMSTLKITPCLRCCICGVQAHIEGSYTVEQRLLSEECPYVPLTWEQRRTFQRMGQSSRKLWLQRAQNSQRSRQKGRAKRRSLRTLSPEAAGWG